VWAGMLFHSFPVHRCARHGSHCPAWRVKKTPRRKGRKTGRSSKISQGNWARRLRWLSPGWFLSASTDHNIRTWHL